MRRFIVLMLCILSLTGCAGAGSAASQWAEMKPVGQMELSYAHEFQVDYYEDGLSLITVSGEDRYLLIPEGGDIPQGLEPEITVIRQPCSAIYLAASSAMDLFRALDALDCVRLTSTSGQDWSIEGIRERMDAGALVYAGKYNAPDYELLLSQGCTLAVESTMIYHKPQVKEQLEALGIPVLVERSSYETHPLGRLEWVRLYGLLTGHQQAADELFSRQAQAVEQVSAAGSTGKTAAFFYVTANGTVSIRRPGDYVSKMIALAGGEYLFSETDEADSLRSTMNIQMEDFYAKAKDADVLIYNSTIGGEISTVEELLALSPLFSDFRAVQQGDVWCTGQNLFQQTSAVADMISDFHTVFTYGADGADRVTYLNPVK